MASTYVAAAIAVPFAASKYMIDVFNPSGSGKVLRVYRVWIENNQVSGVTGVLSIQKLYRTTAASSGITIVPSSHDTSNTALGTVSAGYGRTVTASSLFRNIFFSTDEALQLSGTCDEWQQFKSLTEVWNSGSTSSAIDPIVCREGQGVAVQNSTAGAVGLADLFIEFTVT